MSAAVIALSSLSKRFGERAVLVGHHRRPVAEHVRRQREAVLQHQRHGLGRGGDEVLADVGVVGRGHRVVAVDVEVAAQDRHRDR